VIGDSLYDAQLSCHRALVGRTTMAATKTVYQLRPMAYQTKRVLVICKN